VRTGLIEEARKFTGGKGAGPASNEKRRDSATKQGALRA